MTLDQFAGLSVVLTGFPLETILPKNNTQQVAQELLAVINTTDLVPATLLAQLTTAWAAIPAGLPLPALEAQVQTAIMGNATLARLAQNIIYLWYVGIWYDMTANPASFDGNNFVVSSNTYKNGLVWRAMGAHPMGYSVGEYGYWANQPTIPAIPS